MKTVTIKLKKRQIEILEKAIKTQESINAQLAIANDKTQSLIEMLAGNEDIIMTPEHTINYIEGNLEITLPENKKEIIKKEENNTPQ